MISREVSRGSTGSNSPVSMPSRRINSTTLRMSVLVGADRFPAVLDRGQHHLVDALLGEQIFLVIGEDFEDQPLHALGRGPRSAPPPRPSPRPRRRQRWQIASTIAFLEGKKR